MPTRQATPKELAEVPELLFRRVWEYTKAFDDREKHFNDLQSRYRALASTWLLAAFGGIGFVLSTDLKMAVPKDAIVAGIAVVGALGIALLWVVDVLVYHELLIASHVAGQQLEKALSWLPPIRTHFSVKKKHWPVRKYIALFYVAGVNVLCLGTACLLLFWSEAHKGWVVLVLLVGAALAAAITALTGEAVKWKQALPVWMRDGS
jgi:hypothetical protein